MKAKSLKRSPNSYIAISNLVLVLVSCYVFQSCEKDKVQYKLNIPKQYVEIGELHNEGLEHVYQALKKEAISSLESKETGGLKSATMLDYYSIVNNDIEVFCKQNDKLRDSFQDYKKMLFSTSNTLKSGNLNMSEVNIYSDKQKDLIALVLQSVKQRFNKKEIPQFKALLNSINESASSELSEEDALVIYCATSVAFSSYQYWLMNSKKWYFTLNCPEILETYKDEQLNQLQMKDGSLILKSDSVDEPVAEPEWWDSAWTSVEDWWEEGTSEDEMEWLYGAIEEMAETDVLGGMAGLALGPPAAVGVALTASGLEGINQLWDKND